MSRSRVLITVPNTHWLRVEVAERLLLLQADRRYETRIWLPSRRPYENNQHHIVVSLLDGIYDYWLSIDADNPPCKNPLDLVELDKDLIGLPTPVWHWTGKADERPIYWNGYDWDEATGAYREHVDKDGLQEVDAIGTGCFLAARRIFESPLMRGGCFARKCYPNGTVEYGNDLSFCQRVKRQGFTIHCHYDYPCRHFSEIDLQDVGFAIKGLVTEADNG